jgi:hypothetical protein
MEVDSAAGMLGYSRVEDVHEHPVKREGKNHVQLAALVGEGRRRERGLAICRSPRCRTCRHLAVRPLGL